MNPLATDRFTVSHAAELYGLDAWGSGYLSIGKSGHLQVRPAGASGGAIDVHDVVTELTERGVKTPLLLRFPQLLGAQLDNLTASFRRAIAEYEYAEGFRPVFPVKVNQQRPVVEGLLSAGKSHGLGLEVGSRPELMAAAAPGRSGGLAVDLQRIQGRRVPVQRHARRPPGPPGRGRGVEKPFELDAILRSVTPEEPSPLIGFRIRLQARGSGLWERSGGVASKFGLTTRQLLESVARLEAAGLIGRVALLHFHIGSQITEIRKVKNAVREGSRIYAKLRKKGVDDPLPGRGRGTGRGLRRFERRRRTPPINYSVQEYANDVVFGVSEVCEEEGVPPPTLICESGRMLTAYHSMLITDVRDVISGIDPVPVSLDGSEHPIVEQMAEVDREITVKNYREFYHDAIEYRDQMYSLFNLGMLPLEDRAKAESLFWVVAGKALHHSKSAKHVAEEFLHLEARLHDKYICNFSVFQSLPDHWALDQLFPVMPIHRLNEPPTRMAALVDITCDSDGEVDKFVDRRQIKPALEVHELVPGNPYYLAFTLIGAYQDTMGDLHNLFGKVHEAEVALDPEGQTTITGIRRGESASDTLSYFGYDQRELVDDIRAGLERKVGDGSVDADEAAGLLEDYRQRLRSYTYLD